MTGSVLAVDGGNSKTDLALVGLDGAVLATARGPGSSPHHLGLPAAVDRIGGLYADAMARSGLTEPPAVGVLMLAGADLDAEERALLSAVETLSWARRTIVRNDTFAVLRSGTERGWGVAVVCGAGINAVGVAPDGRTARFLSLGPVSGDWGGGYDLGLGALAAAVRAEDGRGPATSLTELVPAFFDLAGPAAVSKALHTGALSRWRLAELPPLVLSAAAGGDAGAAELVDRLGDEVAAYVRAALDRLELLGSDADVVLGGGVLRARDPRLDERVATAVRTFAPLARIRHAPAPPLLGAALIALDEAGADPVASERLRHDMPSPEELLAAGPVAAPPADPMLAADAGRGT